jgi:hypothetical protein
VEMSNSQRPVSTQEDRSSGSIVDQKWRPRSDQRGQLPLTLEQYRYLSLVGEGTLIDAKRLTSLTVFQLVDEGLLSHDDNGNLSITRQGANALAGRGLISIKR